MNIKPLMSALIATTLMTGTMQVNAFIDRSYFEPDYEEQVLDQLRLIQIAGLAEDWEIFDDRLIEELSEGESESFFYKLHPGFDYQFVGVCDEDCFDVDIALYDENGFLLGDDDDETDVAVVDYSPYRTTWVELQLDMYGCDASTCIYGVIPLIR